MGYMLPEITLATNSIESVESVPLTGLTYRGQPSNVPVPAWLPPEFINHADDILVQRVSFLNNLTMLVFIPSNEEWTITVWAIAECPKFVALDYYHYKTEVSKYYTYSIGQDITEVTCDESTAFLETFTLELAKQYCEDSI